jgi:hypothetical protein
MDLKATLRARRFKTVTLQLTTGSDDGTPQDWTGVIRKIAPPEYLRIFGSVFPDLDPTKIDVEELAGENISPEIAAKMITLARDVVVAGVVTSMEDSTPLITDEEVAAMDIADLRVISDAILEFSGYNKESRDLARAFPGGVGTDGGAGGGSE